MNPLLNLAAFVAFVLLAAVLFWPGSGLFPRMVRERLVATRVRVEDALKHVYHQQAEGQTATLSSVGGALEVSSGRVVTLVQRMQQAGLARLTDGRVLLTGDGERYALQVIRAHRLWERYLADETGVDPRQWHAHAERREHTMTLHEVDALAERLGDPRFDPHGDPIPTAELDVPGQERRVLPLSEMEAGEQAEVVFAELVAQGIHLGSELRVHSSDDERVVFDVDGRAIALAPIMAANVSVRPLRAEHAGEPAAVTLADLEIGRPAKVARIGPACRGIERRRLMDLGIVPGTIITPERRSMTGDPVVYCLRGTRIALRREQARTIAVTTASEAEAAEAGRAAP